MRAAKKLIFSVLLLTACGSQHPEDYQREGERITQELVQELQKVHTLQEMQTQKKRLQREFLLLAELMVKSSRKYRHEPIPPLTEGQRRASQLLAKEIARIATIDGGKELLQSAQEPALQLLERHQKLLEN